jgi:hypothetical protein
MDSIDIQYIWKAIQESERSDENLYPNATLSDRFFEECHSEPERSDGEEPRGAVPPGGFALLPSRPKPDASSRLEGRLIDG